MNVSNPRQPPDAEQAPIGWLLAAAGEHAAATFRAMLPDGLHPRQFAVLQLVAGAAQPLSQAEVAGALGIPASRVVAILDQLEEHQLLARRRDPNDRRAHRLLVTPEGRTLLADLERVVDEANRKAVSPLSDGEQEQLRALLTRIIAAPHVW